MDNHDHYFKILLQNHFENFIKFTIPELYEEIDFTDFSHEDFLSQEQLAEMDGQLHRLDLITKVKLKNHPQFNSVYAIVFIEAQHKRTKDFPARVFRYFCHLYLKFQILILPIVIYSDRHLWRDPDYWNSFHIEFANQPILQFKFFVYKPSLSNTKDYLRSTNPAELALAALMKYKPSDLIKLKLQLIRQLNKLKSPQNHILDLFKFIDNYLETSGEDFQKELDLFKEEAQEESGMLVEHFTNEGIKIGVEQGIELGREEGREEGIEQNKLDIVQKMLASNLPWKDITKFTGLTESAYRSAIKSKESD